MFYTRYYAHFTTRKTYGLLNNAFGGDFPAFQMGNAKKKVNKKSEGKQRVPNNSFSPSGQCHVFTMKG